MLQLHSTVKTVVQTIYDGTSFLITSALCTCVQVQLDSTAYNVVLAALVDAEQLEGSLSLLTDMQAQGLRAEVVSCDRLVMLLLMAGELQVACKVILVCGSLTRLFCPLLQTHSLCHSPTLLAPPPPLPPPPSPLTYPPTCLLLLECW